jgi:mannosylglycoprotein endo-beta-mannosidase
LPPILGFRKSEIYVELWNIYANEELLWYQKSHEKWLLEGDSNTSYFHRVANGRKRKNTMLSLNDNGVNIEGTENLIEHATSYYKNLFGPAPGNIFHFNYDMWSPQEKLDNADNDILSKPFTLDEVRDALFSMKKIKLLALTIYR